MKNGGFNPMWAHPASDICTSMGSLYYGKYFFSDFRGVVELICVCRIPAAAVACNAAVAESFPNAVCAHRDL